MKERIIEQTGPDEVDVDVLEGEVKGLSWIQELTRLFDEAEREMRKSKRRRGRPSSEVQIPTISNGGRKKPPAKGTGGVE